MILNCIIYSESVDSHDSEGVFLFIYFLVFSSRTEYKYQAREAQLGMQENRKIIFRKT